MSDQKNARSFPQVVSCGFLRIPMLLIKPAGIFCLYFERFSRYCFGRAYGPDANEAIVDGFEPQTGLPHSTSGTMKLHRRQARCHTKKIDIRWIVKVLIEYSMDMTNRSVLYSIVTIPRCGSSCRYALLCLFRRTYRLFRIWWSERHIDCNSERSQEIICWLLFLAAHVDAVDGIRKRLFGQ